MIKRLSSQKTLIIEDILFFHQFPMSQKSQKRKYLTKKVREVALENNAFKRTHSNIAILIDIDTCNESRIPDIDNCCKPVLDALKGIVYDDDSQVISLQANYHNGNEEGYTIFPSYLPVFAQTIDKNTPAMYITIGRVERTANYPASLKKTDRAMISLYITPSDKKNDFLEHMQVLNKLKQEGKI